MVEDGPLFGTYMELGQYTHQRLKKFLRAHYSLIDDLGGDDKEDQPSLHKRRAALQEAVKSMRTQRLESVWGHKQIFSEIYAVVLSKQSVPLSEQISSPHIT